MTNLARLNEALDLRVTAADALEAARAKRQRYCAQAKALSAEIDTLRDEARINLQSAVALGNEPPPAPDFSALVAQREALENAATLCQPDITAAEAALKRLDERVREAEFAVVLDQGAEAVSELRQIAPRLLNVALHARRMLQGHALNDHLKLLSEVFRMGDHDMFFEGN